MDNRPELNPAPPAGPGERRRSRRIKLEAIVHYHMHGSEFINLATNISSEGIFIKNFTPPPVGSELRVRANLPPDLGGGPVHLIGKVARVVDGVGLEERGMGVEFTSVQADSPEAVRAFVREVYELPEVDELEPIRDGTSGRFSYTPRPEDALRFGSSLPETGELALKDWRPAWIGLLLLTGALVGGGIVFLLMAR
jgi:hypothetical protein